MLLTSDLLYSTSALVESVLSNQKRSVGTNRCLFRKSGVSRPVQNPKNDFSISGGLKQKSFSQVSGDKESCRAPPPEAPEHELQVLQSYVT